MLQLPLLGAASPSPVKGAAPGHPDGNAGLDGLLLAAEDAAAGFSGELQAMLMQMTPQMLQRLDELVTGGMSLPQAARSLLTEGGFGGTEELFADFLRQGMPALEEKLMGGPVPQTAGQEGALPKLAENLPAGREGALPKVAENLLAGREGALPKVAENLLAGREGALAKVVENLLVRAEGPGDLVQPAPSSAVAPLVPLQGPAAQASPLPPQLAASLLDMGVPQQVGGKGWQGAIADRIMWMVQGEQQFAKLQLNPPNLGPLEVRININQDQASVSFMAQHAAVREALEAALPRLREMFDQQSMQLVRADVGDPGARHGDRAQDSSGRATAQPASSGADELNEDGSDDNAMQVVAGTASSLIDLFA